ncbi:hypothetical protein [Rhodomicrobium lacus]|uniref:hypothetical protein n=1 Tax=Rhodomicrobium lacus TaxID=2498452 RepID=UPI0026E492ED|nr:hypothetical protein [Rhodomicrobium lacus]WKW50142.1 hypothetical protein QMO75_12715 [Rhodomicrobium lacus]
MTVAPECDVAGANDIASPVPLEETVRPEVETPETAEIGTPAACPDEPAVSNETGASENKSAGGEASKKTSPKMPGKKTPPADPLAEKEDDFLSGEFSDVVHRIENLKEDEARFLSAQFEEKHERDYFVLGGILSAIRTNGWFKPHPTFDAWVEEETGMRRAKAHALIRLYDTLAEFKIPQDKFMAIGWTKLRAIAPVMTKENAPDWLEKAAKSSKRDLVEMVRKAKLEAKGKEAAKAEKPMPKTFRLYKDQAEVVEAALDRAKAQGGTKNDNAALELICGDYMGSMAIEERLKNLMPDVLAKTVANVIKSYNEENASIALDIIRKLVSGEAETEGLVETEALVEA